MGSRPRRVGQRARAMAQLEELLRIAHAYPFEYTSELWVKAQMESVMSDQYPDWRVNVCCIGGDWEMWLRYYNGRRIRVGSGWFWLPRPERAFR